MVKRSRGSLSKSTKRLKIRKKPTVSAMVRSFDVGEKVILAPSHIVAGRFPLKYRGTHGVVVEKRGRSYVVEIMDGGKRKRLITNPAHLKNAG